MATRSHELVSEYGHNAKKIDRVKAGYRPKPIPEDEKSAREYPFKWIVSGLINLLSSKGGTTLEKSKQN
jgi:hypothetical protein